MDSISSLVKKHCHCGVNIICGLLLTLYSALSVVKVAIFPQTANIIVCIISITITLFCWIYIFGFKIGCTLLRIPMIIVDFLSFITSLLLFVIGLLFLNHDEAGSYINQVLTGYGLEKISTTPYVIGIVSIVAGIILFALSFCILAGVRYFHSIKKCLEGEIKRNGAKIFGVSAIVLFVFSTISLILFTASMLINRNFVTVVTSFPSCIFYAHMWLVAFILLFVGLSANSFSNKTYAFKVFENKIMKVESNADGTVYVPIDEENETTFGGKVVNTEPEKPAAVEVTPNKAQQQPMQPIPPSNNEVVEKHKPYIPEGQVDIPKPDKKVKQPTGSTGESDII